MVKKFQSTAILVVFLSSLANSAKFGLNWLNGIAITSSALALLLEFIGGKIHE